VNGEIAECCFLCVVVLGNVADGKRHWSGLWGYDYAFANYVTPARRLAPFCTFKPIFLLTSG